MKDLLKWLGHNKPLVISMIITIIALGVIFIGCATTTSPISGDEVSRAVLNKEVKNLINDLEVSYQDLDNKEEFIAKATDLLAAYANGSINELGIVTGAIGLIGIGGIATYGKKDTLITALQNIVKDNNTTKVTGGDYSRQVPA